MNPWIDFQDLRWQSDWTGDEVGHPDYKILGLYQWRDTNVYLYLDVDMMEIVNIWENDGE